MRSADQAAISFGRVTSTGSTSALAVLACAPDSLSRLRLRAESATLASRSISARATASPMPWLAPMTQTRRPVQSLIGVFNGMSKTCYWPPDPKLCIASSPERQDDFAEPNPNLM